METILLFAGAGVITGLLAGLFGIGGGLILIPVLAFMLKRLGIEENLMHMAIGTSLATISLTALASTWSHHRRGAVQWPVFLHLAPGMVVGVAVGAWVAKYLPSTWLSGLFGGVALCMALYIALDRNPALKRSGIAGPAIAIVQTGWLLIAAGLLLGVLPGIVGIGGGLLLVPFLLWRGLLPVHAVGTSAACTLPVGIVGALSYVVIGQQVTGLPAASWGYVYLPAVLGIAALSMLTAPLGAMVAHYLPRQRLRQSFALLLAGVGCWMLL